MRFPTLFINLYEISLDKDTWHVVEFQSKIVTPAVVIPDYCNTLQIRIRSLHNLCIWKCNNYIQYIIEAKEARTRHVNFKKLNIIFTGYFLH